MRVCRAKRRDRRTINFHPGAMRRAYRLLRLSLFVRAPFSPGSFTWATPMRGNRTGNRFSSSAHVLSRYKTHSVTSRSTLFIRKKNFPFRAANILRVLHASQAVPYFIKRQSENNDGMSPRFFWVSVIASFTFFARWSAVRSSNAHGAFLNRK